MSTSPQNDRHDLDYIIAALVVALLLVTLLEIGFLVYTVYFTKP